MARASVLALRSAGHDVVWSGERVVDPGDARLLAEAVADARVFITKDRDFGVLVFRDNAVHCGLLLMDELHDPAAEAVMIVAICADHDAELASGGFLRADASGIRGVASGT